MERQCWSNSQYSRRECLEVTGIPESSESKDLEQPVLKVSEKLEVMVDPANVEDCHWIKTSTGFKKGIIKLLKRRDAAKIRSSRKKLRGWIFPLLESDAKFTLMIAYINITNFLEKNVKACSQTNLFKTFGLLMVLCG